MNYIHIRYFFR